MKLIISNVSGVPIYEQIKQQVKAAILSGELKEEEALPSLRTLAKDLKISVLISYKGLYRTGTGRVCQECSGPRLFCTWQRFRTYEGATNLQSGK